VPAVKNRDNTEKKSIFTQLWKSVFRNKRKDFSTDEDTIPLKTQGPVDGDKDETKPLTSITASLFNQEIQFPTDINPTHLIASCAQSVGRKRAQNEDSMFCLSTIMSSNGEVEPFGLYIVADGMGGHQHGEIASEIATRTMAEHVIRKLITNLICPDPQPPEESIQEIMKSGIEKAHENILEKALGGGTTLTSVTLFSNQMTIAHVGDSRIYSINQNGKISPLTRDHSLVKRLEELGQLTTEEAAIDPRRNVLYHALGQEVQLEPEIISSPIPNSGYLIVCSDGLWGVISEKKIIEIVKTSKTISKASQALVNAANEAGGPDNITVILVKLPFNENE